nr:type II toxin-antitoxin system VapC family toxin [Polymorphobacter sp.]
MISFDTNVLARAILGDDEQQSPIAVALLARTGMVVPTVLLELVWVLGSKAGWSRPEIASALDDLLDIRTLTIVESEAVEWAVARYAAGADFADMLHLALSGEATVFATFDKDIVRFADAGVVPVETLVRV